MCGEAARVCVQTLSDHGAWEAVEGSGAAKALCDQRSGQCCEICSQCATRGRCSVVHVCVFVLVDRCSG